MFLFAITKYEIAQNFQSVDVEELKINSAIVTIVTDNFLSKCILESNGFSIIESPLVSSTAFNEIIFSQVSYDKNKNVFKIFKSTSSGRPIYYHITSKGEFFCSTHISMLRKANVVIEENSEALPEFFVYRYVMPPQTLYKDIKQLIAGSQLCIKLINGKSKIILVNRYTPPTSSKNERYSINNIAKHTLNLLNESIKALNSCNDRLSILLSGGLDSSILFKICQSNYEIDTSYSTGYPFEDPEKNIEKEYALSAADAFHIKHKYYEVTTKKYLKGFVEGISAAEEPLHHLQSVMFYLLFGKGLQKTKDVVVSGQGADGLFGLPLHRSLFQSEKFKFLSKFPFLKLLKFASHATDKGQDVIYYLDKKSLPLSNANNILWSLGAYGSEDWVSNYFKIKEFDVVKERFNTIKPFEYHSIYDVISILDLFGDVSITQSIWSKLGESQHKIVYYPFNDINILNYIFSIPWVIKLKNPKNILRCVARQMKIPNFIITRPKSSFGIQSKRWSAKGGDFEPLVPLASKVFDGTQICKMQSSDPKKAMTFWNMLNYSIWKRLCIHNEPLDVLLEELNESI